MYMLLSARNFFSLSRSAALAASVAAELADSRRQTPNALLPADYTFTPSDSGTYTSGAVLFARGQQTLIVTDTESGVASSIMIMVG